MFIAASGVNNCEINGDPNNCRFPTAAGYKQTTDVDCCETDKQRE